MGPLPVVFWPLRRVCAPAPRSLNGAFQRPLRGGRAPLWLRLRTSLSPKPDFWFLPPSMAAWFFLASARGGLRPPNAEASLVDDGSKLAAADQSGPSPLRKGKPGGRGEVTRGGFSLPAILGGQPGGCARLVARRARRRFLFPCSDSSAPFPAAAILGGGMPAAETAAGIDFFHTTSYCGYCVMDTFHGC